MTTRDLARFFVRFQALCFLFYAIYELSNFPAAYRNFKLLHEFQELDSAMAEEFWIVVARIGLQLAAAVFLFGWSEKLINLLNKGTWTVQALETTDSKACNADNSPKCH